mmetsp:Transcript_17877/g.36062  ORF Transcript_17877/g.36062 Transcript_17877/m.36062 type:complete len:216 (+) Transcript_17877:1219-1866(+)
MWSTTRIERLLYSASAKKGLTRTRRTLQCSRSRASTASAAVSSPGLSVPLGRGRCATNGGAFVWGVFSRFSCKKMVLTSLTNCFHATCTWPERSTAYALMSSSASACENGKCLAQVMAHADWNCAAVIDPSRWRSKSLKHSSTRKRCCTAVRCIFSSKACNCGSCLLYGTFVGWLLVVGGRPGCKLRMGPATTRSFQNPDFIVGTAPYCGSWGKT